MPFEKTEIQNIWCLLIINLHITMYDVSLALQTHFLHMVLTSWTGISLIVGFFKNITPANSEGLLSWKYLPHISLQTWAGINTGCETGGAENDQLKLTVQQWQQKCFRISASCTTEYQNTVRCVPRSNFSNNFTRDPCHNKITVDESEYSFLWSRYHSVITLLQDSQETWDEVWTVTGKVCWY